MLIAQPGCSNLAAIYGMSHAHTFHSRSTHLPATIHSGPIRMTPGGFKVGVDDSEDRCSTRLTSFYFRHQSLLDGVPSFRCQVRRSRHICPTGTWSFCLLVCLSTTRIFGCLQAAKTRPTLGTIPFVNREISQMLKHTIQSLCHGNLRPIMITISFRALGPETGLLKSKKVLFLSGHRRAHPD